MAGWVSDTADRGASRLRGPDATIRYASAATSAAAASQRRSRPIRSVNRNRAPDSESQEFTWRTARSEEGLCARAPSKIPSLLP
jgi:hypothetical protein